MHNDATRQDPDFQATDLAQTSLPEVSEAANLPARQRALTMFGIGLAVLVLLAVALPHGDLSESFVLALWQQSAFIYLLFGLWAVIVLESAIGVFAAPDKFKPALMRLLLIVLLPPYRMTISTRRPNDPVWLPGYGHLKVSKETLDRIDMRLGMPMLLITLLILPVIGVEMLWHEQIAEMPAVRFLIHMITALIWFAFALEFILQVSVAPKKADYCKRHWINIVIILLPLLAFLRTLQMFRFLRMAKAGKLLRAYKLRGVFARALRLALLLNVIERLMERNIERYVGHLEIKLEEKEQELSELRTKLNSAREKLAARDGS